MIAKLVPAVVMVTLSVMDKEALRSWINIAVMYANELLLLL